MSNGSDRRELARIERESKATNDVLTNDDVPSNLLAHSRPTVVGDAVEIGDRDAYIAAIRGDVVHLGERDGSREFVVPTELVPSHCVRNPVE